MPQTFKIRLQSASRIAIAFSIPFSLLVIYAFTSDLFSPKPVMTHESYSSIEIIVLYPAGIVIFASIALLMLLALTYHYSLDLKKRSISLPFSWLAHKTIPFADIKSILICGHKDLPQYVDRYGNDSDAASKIQHLIQKDRGAGDGIRAYAIGGSYAQYRSGRSPVGGVVAAAVGPALLKTAISPTVCITETTNFTIINDLSLRNERDCWYFGELLRSAGVHVLQPMDKELAADIAAHRHPANPWITKFGVFLYACAYYLLIAFWQLPENFEIALFLGWPISTLILYYWYTNQKP